MPVKGFATRAVHSGTRMRRPDYDPVAMPIFATVGYTYDRMADLDDVFGDRREGYVYSRYANPTVGAFEKAIASLEGAAAAVAYASGMAAVSAALAAARVRGTGRVVSANEVYGASYTLQTEILGMAGAEPVFVPIEDLTAVQGALEETRPSVLYCEALSNPLLRLADLSALARAAHAVGALLLVDATFASPYLLQPLSLGADMVIHSATKYIGGHGDVMGGVIACGSEHADILRHQQRLTGGILGPFEAWLLLRGLQTLPLRVARQCQSALRVAQHLATHPRIAHVYYPGLESHPQHELAKTLFASRGYGGIVSFDLRGAGADEVFRFMDALQLVRPATTLGDVYSLAMYPAHSSHRSVPVAQRVAMGISDGLVRFSAGIEDVEDIIADLDQALAQI